MLYSEAKYEGTQWSVDHPAEYLLSKEFESRQKQEEKIYTFTCC
jgi:hypothetical protein